MPIRDTLRLDLKQANVDPSGDILARRYPLTIWPRTDNQCTAFAVSEINLSPLASMIQLTWLNQAEEIYTYPGNNLSFLGEIVEDVPATLVLQNLNTQAGVSIILTILSYRYNEPRYSGVW